MVEVQLSSLLHFHLFAWLGSARCISILSREILVKKKGGGGWEGLYLKAQKWPLQRVMLPCCGTLGRRSRTGVVVPSSSICIFQTIINSNLYTARGKLVANWATSFTSPKHKVFKSIKFPSGNATLRSLYLGIRNT